MATTTRRQRVVKQDDAKAAVTAGETVADQVEDLARHGAREMLMAAMNEEVDAYLGRGRYERDGEFRGYRNGTTPSRSWRR